MRTEKENGIHLFSTKNVCANPFRPIKMVKDIFTSPEKASKDSNSIVTIELPGSLKQISESMPGRLHFSDVTFDGYPDLLVTVQFENGIS